MMNELFSLQGRTALITGGSRGIGNMIATAFSLGAPRSTFLRAKRLPATRPPPNCPGRRRNLRLPAAGRLYGGGLHGWPQRTPKHEPKLDILVNNAGAAWEPTFDAFPESGWDKVMDLNLKSPFFLTQALDGALRPPPAPSSQPT